LPDLIENLFSDGWLSFVVVSSTPQLLTTAAAAGQAKQQKNPGAVVACIKQLDWMTGLGINSISGSSVQRRR
jgi:hypothetical protein